MDFKCRVGEEGASSYIPPRSSNGTFFISQPPLRASIPRTTTGVESNGYDVNELIRREAEKKMIRKEIIAAEILRRLELEAEVRRELQIERDAGMINGEGIYLTPSDMQVPRMSLMTGGGSGAMPFQRQPERFMALRRPEVGCPKQLPFQRHTEAGKPAIEPLPERKTGQVLFLGKPTNSNLAGVKRKAETMAISRADGVHSVNPSKKSQKEWSCAICRVSATSERGLNDHLQGRKHKAKEALLRSNKMEHTDGSNLLPKKAEKSIEHAVTAIMPIEGNSQAVNEFKIKPIEQRSQDVNEVEIKPIEGHIRNVNEVLKNDKAMARGMQITELEENGRYLADEKQETVDPKMQKPKYWCLMCKVGANSEAQMDIHQTGRKHMARLLENGGAVITINSMPECVQEAEEAAMKEGVEVNADVTAEFSMTEGKGDSFEDAVKANETTAVKGEEVSPDNGEAREITVKRGSDDSLGNAEEAEETAINMLKEYLLGCADVEIDGVGNLEDQNARL
ncbi:uncharacterized protein LOC131151199 [Malania oleifera]|uniref:uncharacterized protein LOC131151199 n=1 Tax=Malania oleifera TaxID=397392 RepID=UPI0025AE0D6B|nr:uncharacterized protein LOC131151199 [Malania oleifera]